MSAIGEIKEGGVMPEVKFSTLIREVSSHRRLGLTLLDPTVPVTLYQARPGTKIHCRVGCASVTNEIQIPLGELHAVDDNQWCGRCCDHASLTVDDTLNQFLAMSVPVIRSLEEAQLTLTKSKEFGINPITFTRFEESVQIVEKAVSRPVDDRVGVHVPIPPEELVRWVDHFDDQVRDVVAGLRATMSVIVSDQEFHTTLMRAAAVASELDVPIEHLLGPVMHQMDATNTFGSIRELVEPLLGTGVVARPVGLGRAIVKGDWEALRSKIAWSDHLAAVPLPEPRFHGGDFTSPKEWARAEWELWRDERIDQFTRQFDERVASGSTEMVVVGSSTIALSSLRLQTLFEAFWPTCHCRRSGRAVMVVPRVIAEFIDTHTSGVRRPLSGDELTVAGDMDVFLQVVIDLWDPTRISLDDAVDTALATLG